MVPLLGFFGMFDPYYLLLAVVPGIILSGGASLLVQFAFKSYSKVGTSSGMTGAMAAQRLLDRAGIYDVRIVPVAGNLTDHYNPTDKTLALSESVYSSTSVAAVGVATHEAGHAIQHAVGYFPLKLRAWSVPAANIGSQFGMIAMFIGLGLMTTKTFFGPVVFLIGVALFSMVLLFQLITLPVEFDASLRARRLVVEAGIVRPEERTGIDRVLGAAALTYVAAAATTAITLLYFILRSGILNRR